jgi:hypothetical protein
MALDFKPFLTSLSATKENYYEICPPETPDLVGHFCFSCRSGL